VYVYWSAGLAALVPAAVVTLTSTVPPQLTCVMVTMISPGESSEIVALALPSVTETGKLYDFRSGRLISYRLPTDA